MEYTSQTAAFMMISKAGDASANYLKAFNECKKGNFEVAEELCEDARVELDEAHKIQTQIIQSEARGESFDVDVLMVHAQDHLMNAMLIRELSTHILELYKKTEA